MVHHPRGGGAGAAPADQTPPLAGFTVAVASDRRRHPIAGLLDSSGARTVSVQAFRTIAQPDEDALRTATDACLRRPSDEVVISSGLGLRAWLTAARRWGVEENLIASFTGARLLARDPAAADSLRALGLSTIWSTAGAATEELLRYLLAQQLNGRRIVVQTQAPTLHDVCHALGAAGADVVAVPTHHTTRPLHVDFLRRLADLITSRQIDAVVFAGETATRHLLAYTDSRNTTTELLHALRAEVLCASLSPLTSRLLAERGVRPSTGSAPFVEELAGALLRELPETAIRLVANGRQIEVRGHAVIIDGRLVNVQRGPLAVLRTLARRAGRLVTMADIRAEVPGWSTMEDHAIEMAVSRLRRALDDRELVQTIVRRGYRLSL